MQFPDPMKVAYELAMAGLQGAFLEEAARVRLSHYAEYEMLERCDSTSGVDTSAGPPGSGESQRSLFGEEDEMA